MVIYKTNYDKVIALKSSTHYSLVGAWRGLARAVHDKDQPFASCCYDSISALIHSFCVLFEIGQKDHDTMSRNALKLYMKVFEQ